MAWSSVSLMPLRELRDFAPPLGMPGTLNPKPETLNPKPLVSVCCPLPELSAQRRIDPILNFFAQMVALSEPRSNVSSGALVCAAGLRAGRGPDRSEAECGDCMHFAKLEKAECSWWSWCSKPSAQRAFEDGRSTSLSATSRSSPRPLHCSQSPCMRRSPSLVEFPYFRLDQPRWSELSCSKSSVSRMAH